MCSYDFWSYSLLRSRHGIDRILDLISPDILQVSITMVSLLIKSKYGTIMFIAQHQPRIISKLNGLEELESQK